MRAVAALFRERGARVLLAEAGVTTGPLPAQAAHPALEPLLMSPASSLAEALSCTWRPGPAAASVEGDADAMSTLRFTGGHVGARRRARGRCRDGSARRAHRVARPAGRGRARGHRSCRWMADARLRRYAGERRRGRPVQRRDHGRRHPRDRCGACALRHHRFPAHAHQRSARPGRRGDGGEPTRQWARACRGRSARGCPGAVLNPARKGISTPPRVSSASTTSCSPS
ncbi:hypothetical protein AB5I41_03065 [Sphingomonas sp. MMS24-JH45]